MPATYEALSADSDYWDSFASMDDTDSEYSEAVVPEPEIQDAAEDAPPLDVAESLETSFDIFDDTGDTDVKEPTYTEDDIESARDRKFKKAAWIWKDMCRVRVFLM